ncbi:PKD domain-containing protein [Polaribacter gangjinensis]|uniref:PKD domain-containing protein n=1 Tax=Polaribacter gangjinensis TaxID=574710 RepID=A0A2S7W9T2_9FLAO|nr:PKD domain-containing protein [Polaribacter gangjinensis]PQJ74176.1 hypothetical protein BTO13_02300 [Polaribacter gangjinensis]
MKFKKKLRKVITKKTQILTFLAVSVILLNAYGIVRLTTLLNHFYSLSATIKAEKSEVCINESTLITFEAIDGIPPYTFTYQINGGAETDILTIGEAKTVSLNFDAKNTAGVFVYKLIKITDNSGDAPVVLDEQTTINVNAPPDATFTITNDNSCSGETVEFNSNVLESDTLSYLWDFGDGKTSTLKNPTTIYNDLLGCGTRNFTVKLTVTDANGCINTTSQVVRVLERPDIKFRDELTRSDIFSNCDNASASSSTYEISVENISTSSCLDSFFIDWGDGNTTISASFPAKHTYLNIGVYKLKIKGLGSNGCENEVTYEVKNVSNPAGGLASPGNTSNLCLVNSELTFPITNYELNSFDTTYTIDFGDGTPKETYTQDEIQNNNKITHKYLKGSCNEVNGEFIATLAVQNACDTTTFTVDNIVILESSKAEFSSIEKTCVNTNIIFQNNSILGEESGCIKNADVTWNFGDGTIKKFFSVNTINNIQHLYTVPGTYDVTLSINTKCGISSFTKEICIEPEITPSFDVNALEGCIPFQLNTTNTTDLSQLCSAPTYDWTISYQAANCETASDWEFIDSSDKTSENPKFLFKKAGIYTITRKISTECGDKFTSKVITVKKPPITTINPISDFCENSKINPTAVIENCTQNPDGVIYKWTFPGGIPASSTSLNPGEIVFNTPGIYTISLEVTNECGVSNTATQTFEVFETPTINNTDLIQEICSGENTNEIIFNSNNPETVYSWVAITNGNIVGFIPNGNTNSIPSQTLINDDNGNNKETITYRVTPTLNSCVGDPVDFVITVYPNPIISKQPQSSEVCLNGIATTLEIDYTRRAGTPAYQWFVNTTNVASGGTSIDGATASSYDPPTDTVGTNYYYVEISFTSGGCDKIVSDVATVTVTPQLTIDSVATNQSICVGGTAAEFEVTFTGGTGTPSYQWFSNTINSNSGGTAIAGATNAKYTPAPFNTDGSFFYYATVSLSGNGCTSANSNVYQVNVIPDAIIDAQPLASQELCQNAIPTDLSVVASGGTASNKTYQWYRNNTNSTIGGTAIVGATNSSYTPSSTTIGTQYYYVIISQSDSGCSVTSSVATVKINEAPIVTTQPQSSEVCLDGDATLLEVVYEKGTGTPAYQWFVNTTNVASGGTSIDGATASSYDPPTDTVGTNYYYVEISFDSGGCDKIVSDVATVTVTPQLTIDSVATNQSICIGGTAAEFEVTFTGGTGTPSYQWFSNTINSNSGGTAIAGATNAKYTPAPFNTDGSFFYYATVSLSGNGCNSANSNVYQVNVIPDPIIDAQPLASQELCQNAIPADLSVVASGGTASNKTYQWYRNNTNSTIGGTAIVGATNSSYTPSSTTIGTQYYYVIISQSDSGCSVTSSVATVKINEAPIVTTQPQSSEVCLGDNATTLEVAYQNGVGIATHQWFLNSVNSNTGGTAIIGATNTSYIPPTNAIGTIYYYVEINFTDGGCSKIVSDVAAVIVNQIPVIANDSITIYSSETFTYNPSILNGNIVPNNTQYTWIVSSINPAGSIIGSSNAISGQNIISQTLENTGTTPARVTYTISPFTDKCKGSDFTLEVVVNPTITPNEVITNNSCFNSNDASITTNITGGIPFETGKPYLINWTGPNGFLSTDSSIFNLVAGSYTLRIEDKEGYFITRNFTITQPDNLIINTDSTKNISCFQGNDGSIKVTVTGGTTPYTYNWTTLNGSGLVQNTNSQNGLTAGNYTLEVIDKNNCSTTLDFVLTEPDGLEISAQNIENVLCFGEATGSISINVIGGTPFEISTGIFDYQYAWTGPNGFTSFNKNIANLIAGNYLVKVTDQQGCVTNATFSVTEATKIEPIVTKNDVSCYGETDGSIAISVTGGVAPYQIQWSNLANGFSLNNLSAGTYIATITDANNCESKVTIDINQPIFFIDPIVTPISCNGEKDGSIKLNLTGGIAPFTVLWDDDPSAGIERNNLGAGIYRVLIKDSDPKQCPIEQTFIFTEPPALVVSSTVVDATECDVIDSGSIDLIVAGGTAPYFYKWSNGQTTANVSNLAAGNYAVEITDSNGCKTTRQFSIFRQEPLQIEFETILLTNCETKIVSQQTKAKVTGGFLPYTYTWSDGTVSTTDNSIMTTSQNGSYTLLITDNQGCTIQKSFAVSVPSIGTPDFQFSAFSQNTYNFLSVEDPIQFTNTSTGNFTKVIWDFGDGKPTSNEENPIYTYDNTGEFTVRLTVEYEAGCTYFIERILKITLGYTLINPNAFTPNGDGFNETIRPSFLGFSSIEMSIFDIWGTLVYTEKGTTTLNGWDGNVKGKPAENGNYVMIVKGTTFYGKEISANTSITLIK